MKTENSPIEKIGYWISHSVTLKLIVITILTLLMLIPSAMVQDIIREREALNDQAVKEVSSKWANGQQINGPILTIPLVYEYEKQDKVETVVKYYYVLPHELRVSGDIVPNKLRRGIYEVVVYQSQLRVAGSFDLSQKIEMANLKEIQYDQAFLTVGISDLRGIKEEVLLQWGKRSLAVSPGSKVSEILTSGITIDLPDLLSQAGQEVPFEFSLNLQGSQHLSFVPVGATTEVSLSSPWTSPKFDGNFLPDQREINEEGFQADWKVLQLNRNFPQSWVDTNQSANLQMAAFGVELILPLDDYQKSMRSAKYAAMTIIITFLVFFLVEILNKRKIHPFQYALVGFALSLFYVLLVSLSEHTDFNLAYGVATICVILMISLYSLTIFKASKLTALLVLILIGAYSFLFVTLQLTDYALLMGSVGLTIILGLTMYFTRNVDWYKMSVGKEE
ncbi:cell envelope integrity protein CreD [Echinicola sp. 20G]|uniref:cell envelope integrity protein CreD n=1 Tax=Echinicola sp. 20G TaxID=2781961 RepID=UPI0019102A23|nr:cell envelope integrity protein CreD [Echinicola sp. 20G]